MTVATQSRMTLEEFLAYDDGTEARYELVDGVLVQMGAENPVNCRIAMFLVIAFARLGLTERELAIGHQIAVNSTQATARQPDLIVHSPESSTAILDDGKLLREGLPAPLLVVEVVSSSKTDQKSHDRDYVEKPGEYAGRGIQEYWIIDPDYAWVKVGVLRDGVYDFVTFQGDAVIISPAFPALTLTAEAVLRAGR
jgi:Uma2 family endonuclease